MKTKLRLAILGLIIALAFLSPSFIRAQTAPCYTYTPCYKMNSLDNYQILGALLNMSVTASGGTVSILSNTSAVAVTSSVLTGSGTITAGAMRLDFLTSSAFTGSINGVSWPGNTGVPFPNINYRTYPAITYTVTTGSLNVNVTR